MIDITSSLIFINMCTVWRSWSVKLKHRTSCSLPAPLPPKMVRHWSAMNLGICLAGMDPPIGAFVSRGWKDAFIVRHRLNPSSNAAPEGEVRRNYSVYLLQHSSLCHQKNKLLILLPVFVWFPALPKGVSLVCESNYLSLPRVFKVRSCGVWKSVYSLLGKNIWASPHVRNSHLVLFLCS